MSERLYTIPMRGGEIARLIVPRDLTPTDVRNLHGWLNLFDAIFEDDPAADERNPLPSPDSGETEERRVEG